MTTPRSTNSPPKLVGAKRQHYLPRFYLAGFTGADGCVAVYDRKADQVRRQQPINTGLDGHLYTVVDDQGRKRYELEDVLSKIESDAAQHLPSLVAGQPLSDTARGAIAHFAGVMAVRTPDFISSIRHANGELLKRISQFALSSEDMALSQLRQMPKYAGLDEVELKRMASDLVRFTAEGEYDIETGHEAAMITALPLADDLASVFFERNWTVLKAPRDSAFIASDAGLMLTGMGPRSGRYPLGHGTPDALTVLPLSSQFALAMWGNDRDTFVKKVDGGRVRALNISLARHTRRFVIARDDALALSVSRAARLAQTTWSPKFKVG